MWTIVFVIGGLQSAFALNNGLAKKPPLAYSNWNIVGPNVNETFMRDQADRLVSSGLAGAGYEYVIVDDCWSAVNRSADGKLQANSTTFPSGMKAMGDYLHGKGLKFGIYADAGNLTCQFHPGSRGHEATDAKSFAEWGVDYVKYDNCEASADDWIVDRYSAMSDALNKTGRPMLFAIVGWGVGDPWKGWGEKYGNVWRTAGDITQSWPEILRVLDSSVGLMQYSKPGAWADLDMLEVGVGALTFQEQRAHFAIWAIMKSPLMLGTDLTTISKDQLDMVSAPEVLLVNQDTLGVPGDLIWKEGPAEVYASPLQDGSRAVVLLNRHTLATQYPVSELFVDWTWLGFPSDAEATVRDLFARKDMGIFRGSYTAQVNIHDVIMLRVILKGDASPYKAWRPWTAKSYVPVPRSYGAGVKGVAIAAVVLASLVLVILVGMLVRRLCSGNRRKFGRLEEGGKARRSPSGRLSMDVA